MDTEANPNACEPEVGVDLGSLVIECACRRGVPPLTWTTPLHIGASTVTEFAALAATYAAACEARGPRTDLP